MMDLFSDASEPEFSPSRLVIARMRKGLSQEDLAKIVGIDKSTINKYEQKTRRPDTTVIMQIADALGFPFTFFFQEDLGSIDMKGVSFRARRSASCSGSSCSRRAASRAPAG